VVVLRRPPISSEATTEALRVAVGQSLAPQRVTLCLMGDGVWAAGQRLPNPEEKFQGLKRLE